MTTWDKDQQQRLRELADCDDTAEIAPYALAWRGYGVSRIGPTVDVYETPGRVHLLATLDLSSATYRRYETDGETGMTRLLEELGLTEVQA